MHGECGRVCVEVAVAVAEEDELADVLDDGEGDGDLESALGETDGGSCAAHISDSAASRCSAAAVPTT